MDYANISPMTAAARQKRSRAPNGDEARWAAALARDGSCDGTFVMAVLTTGIYCRPSCPARKPLRKNVRFYPTNAQAEAAGRRERRTQVLYGLSRDLARARTAGEVAQAATRRASEILQGPAEVLLPRPDGGLSSSEEAPAVEGREASEGPPPCPSTDRAFSGAPTTREAASSASVLDRPNGRQRRFFNPPRSLSSIAQRAASPRVLRMATVPLPACRASIGVPGSCPSARRTRAASRSGWREERSTGRWPRRTA